MTQHIVTGAGAPTTAPPSLGAHYIDTTSGALYLARGTGFAVDWVRLDSAAALQLKTNGTDTDVYLGAADRFVYIPGPANTAINIYPANEQPGEHVKHTILLGFTSSARQVSIFGSNFVGDPSIADGTITGEAGGFMRLQQPAGQRYAIEYERFDSSDVSLIRVIPAAPIPTIS